MLRYRTLKKIRLTIWLLTVLLPFLACDGSSKPEGVSPAAAPAERAAEEAVPAIRLLDHLDAAEVAWPHEWQTAPLEDNRVPEHFRPLGEVREGRIEMLPA